MPDIHVLVCDDHAILRDGIRTLLERQEGIAVVGEAGNGREALERVAALKPDIVLMDVAMPEMDGIQATRLIKQQYPDIKVLILTQHDDREFVIPLLQAGASGYVLKRSGGHEVIMAIRQVAEQGVYLAPSATRHVLSDYSRHDNASHQAEPTLTDRERDVLRLVIDGKSNKEIAHLLSISPKTVSVHRSNIMAKLDLHNSVEMLRYATQHHLFDDVAFQRHEL
jgi:DNA-binding NarL/FixJ family response regulator